jgi:hypothetical protein
MRGRAVAGLDRVRQTAKKLGRPKVSPKTEDAIRRHLAPATAILKVCGYSVPQSPQRSRPNPISLMPA